MAVCYATTAILLGWWPWNLPVSIWLVGRYAKWRSSRSTSGRIPRQSRRRAASSSPMMVRAVDPPRCGGL